MRDKKTVWHENLAPETKKSILAVFAFVLAAILALAFVGKGGATGERVFQTLDWLLGSGYFLAPLGLVLIGFSLLSGEQQKIIGMSFVGGLLFLLSSLGALHLIFGTGTGGFLGSALGSPAIKLFDFWAGLVVLLGFFVISLLLIFNKPLWRRREVGKEEKEEKEEAEKGVAGEGFDASVGAGVKAALESLTDAIKSAVEKPQNSSTNPASSTAVTVDLPPSAPSTEESSLPMRRIALKPIPVKTSYPKPPLELLEGDRGKPSSGDIKANANIIKRTLENFGIDVEMGEISIGPTVTQYTLRPAEGVKLARITALHNDLSLALAAHPIRIEAPIPGKSLVGIEVPNRSIALVGLKALLSHKIFQEAHQPLLFALGRDVSGNPVFADLAKMPHLLISGATGSGKSVSIHTILTSFLYRNSPEVLRLILVDPKRVELSLYNDVAHLLTPVITDSKMTIQALIWATREMDRRYDLLSEHKARDLESFNVLAAESREELEHLPYIVIVVDELADLMAAYPREMEGSIIRIAQMARAVGIHLVVATQRPSVEVITGLIKANITSRIAFQVASQIDSRTILDTAGAEKLLGNGDMLFLAGDTAKPRRIQGAFISEPEVKRVVEFIRDGGEPLYDEEILKVRSDTQNPEGEFFGEDDPLYDEAEELVVEAGKASASYLQRRLRVGYARAARLLDLMEAKGVVGPADGAKPREILIKTADYESR